ncbi:MAG: stage II sporulation protein E [Clostridiales bacterium]|jgi:stage II sporulation protein E|nr:stage II sporulation protein E [Clostridiales bacterium]
MDSIIFDTRGERARIKRQSDTASAPAERRDTLPAVSRRGEAARATVKASVFVSKRELASVAVAACGFFVGRAMVFTFVNPLCLPFLATFAGSGHSFYIAALFVLAGLLTRLGEVLTARYLVAAALLCVYEWFVARMVRAGRMPRPKWILQGVAASVCMLVSGVFTAVLYGNSAFLFLVAVIESVLAGSVYLVIKRANVILTSRRRNRLLAGEDIIALSVVAAAVIAGASDIHVGAVPLRYFMCAYVLFLVAYKGGAAMAAAAGLLLGFFLHLAGYWDISMAAALGFAGMAGGLLKKYGRLAVMGGGAVMGGAVMYLLAKSELSFAPLYALVASGLAFMFTPQNFYFNLASAITPTADAADDYMDKIKEETTRRLDAFSAAFGQLAETFSGLSRPKTSLNKADVTQLIDDLAARACAACPDKNRCWEEDFFQTYQYIYALLDACGKKGAAEPSDLDAEIVCKNTDVLLHELNGVYSLYQTNLRWNNRIAESRDLVSQQLYGVSGIIKRLSEEIDLSLKFHDGLEEEMIAALLRNKIEVNSVIVLENKAGKYQVTVSHKPCGGRRAGGIAGKPGANVCSEEILPVINAVLKRRMRVEGQDCDIKKGVCAARFVEDQKLRVTSGVAHRAKSLRTGSGDSYSFMELKNGQCLLVLSDGMGTGERARRESAATVGLLEDFMESGFDKELAVRMINSVLVLKSSEESFSTLDICSLDLYTGDAEFIKIGAASTFLLRNGKVSVVRSSSLPMGMLNNVDLEVSTRKLASNDIILMVTDGITEAAEGDGESWLSETLHGCRYQNPQDVADYILAEAETMVSKTGGKKDDMTVLAAKVWERV